MALEEKKVTPSSPNAWGALIRKAMNDELIVPTKEFRSMITPSSNARQTRVYMINR